MKLCELLEMTKARINITDSYCRDAHIICQVRSALDISAYLDPDIYHAEVVNIEPSEESGCLDVTIYYSKGEEDEGFVELTEDDYE